MSTGHTIRAYAKINLGLRIIGKRPDGYHDIETVFHRINVYDEITLERATDVSCSSTAPELPVDDTNLCVRAARLLQAACKVRTGVKIKLQKTIPVGAGLGGGSADAAATLTALPKFWKRTLPPETLHSMALELGSDTPYFLCDSTAYATGRGDILERFELDIPYWIVVGYPNLHVSTAWAYSETQVPDRSPQIRLNQVLREYMGEPRMLRNLVQNDFEPLLLRTHRRIADLKQSLYNAGAEFALLSGSGSAVFAFFSTQSAARHAASALKAANRVFVTPPHFRPGME